MTHRKQSKPFLTQTEAIDNGADVDALLLRHYPVHEPMRPDEFDVQYAMKTWRMKTLRGTQIRLDKMLAAGAVERRFIGHKCAYKFKRAS